MFDASGQADNFHILHWEEVRRTKNPGQHWLHNERKNPHDPFLKRREELQQAAQMQKQHRKAPALRPSSAGRIAVGQPTPPSARPSSAQPRIVHHPAPSASSTHPAPQPPPTPPPTATPPPPPPQPQTPPHICKLGAASPSQEHKTRFAERGVQAIPLFVECLLHRNHQIKARRAVLYI